jgi:hypothetical protein
MNEIDKVRARLPNAATYVRDYIAYWLNGTCYFFRRNAVNEWVYEK